MAYHSSCGSGRLHYLDSARGIATITVAAYHFLFIFGVPKEVAFIRVHPKFWWVWTGPASMSFFFVLSGFVLSLKYLSDMPPGYREEIKLVPFYLARVARIYPAFLLILVLTFIFQKTLLATPQAFPNPNELLRYFWGKPRTVYEVIREGSLFLDRKSLPIMPQDWSLEVEMICSGVMPFLILVARRGFSWLIALSVFFIVYLSPGMFFINFIVGISIALYFTKITTFVIKIPAAVRLFLGIAALVFSRMAYPVPLNLSGRVFEPTWWGCSFAMGFLLCLIIGSKDWQKYLQLKPLRFIGKISYSLFLVHFTVIFGLAALCSHWQLQPGLKSAHWFALAGAGVLLSMLLACATYAWVERPGRKWAKRFWDPAGKNGAFGSVLQRVFSAIFPSRT